jgi:hypothetical protein
MSPIQGFEIGTSSADVSGLGLGVPVAGRQAPLPTQYAPFVLESPGYATERGLPVVATNDPDSLHQ